MHSTHWLSEGIFLEIREKTFFSKQPISVINCSFFKKNSGIGRLRLSLHADSDMILGASIKAGDSILSFEFAP